MDIAWRTDGTNWYANVGPVALKQKPMVGTNGHWLGLIDNELRVVGGGLDANRARLETMLQEG